MLKKVRMRSRGPLFLFTSPDVSTIFDRSRFITLHNEGKLPRIGMNSFLAKTLPPNSHVLIADNGNDMVEVLESEYHRFSAVPLYAVRDLLRHSEDESKSRVIPGREEILNSLRSRNGVPYLYGGGSVSGSDELSSWLIDKGYFKSEDMNDPRFLQVIQLNGLDCSSLLIDASNHALQPDTKDFGSIGDIVTDINDIQPLDVIVWKGGEGGHMVVALDEDEAIQACGVGENAELFKSAGSMNEYNCVAIDPMGFIFKGLIDIQKRSLATKWEFGARDTFNIVRWYSHIKNRL